MMIIRYSNYDVLYERIELFHRTALPDKNEQKKCLEGELYCATDQLRPMFLVPKSCSKLFTKVK